MTVGDGMEKKNEIRREEIQIFIPGTETRHSAGMIYNGEGAATW